MNSSEVSFLNVWCQTTMKVLRPSNEIRFVDILAAYRTQPQFNREVQSDQDFSGKKSDFRSTERCYYKIQPMAI